MCTGFVGLMAQCGITGALSGSKFKTLFYVAPACEVCKAVTILICMFTISSKVGTASSRVELVKN
jgi:pyruvate/2-oxoacid:ferredoxin oxidoreductase beta subunit